MIRIMITGSTPGIGKTALICRLLKVYSGYAVIQIREKGLFTSITSDVKGEEANLLKNCGAIQVMEIHTDPSDIAEAIDQSICLLPLQTEGILIEGNPSYNDFHKDIVIFLTDCPLNKPDQIPVGVNIVVAMTRYQKDIKLQDPAGAPVFFLDMQDINGEEWKRFLAELTGLIDSQKT